PPGKSFASLYGSALPSISSRPHETWLIRGERFFSVTTTKSPAKGRAVVLEAVCIARYLVRVKLTFLGTRGEIEARTRRHRMPSQICGITFEAFPVEHSILAPAVGYRVRAGRALIFYGPDLLFIHDRKAALREVQVYIGDGATLTRSLVRKRGGTLIGHAPV